MKTKIYKNHSHNIFLLVILIIVFVLLIFTINIKAQQGWFWQNPLPQGNDLKDVWVFDENNAVAVGDAGTVIKTMDGGTTWNPQSSGTTWWLSSVHFTDNNTGWVVGWDGTILKTTNGGTNWIPQSSGTEFLDLHGVSFTDANNGSAVGSEGTILRTTNGGVTFVEEEIDEIPTEFLLSQNWPNPFNSTSVIRYSVPQSSQVQIKVFDILGNEIETLVNEEKQIGTYEITWNAENLTSGIYLYQLRAGSYLHTKKMVLMK